MKDEMERLLKEFRKTKNELLANTTTTSNKSSQAQSSFMNKVIHVDNSDEDRSVVSAFTRNTITETLPCVTKPTTTVADVDITMRCGEMKRYKNIRGRPIDNAIDNSNCIPHVRVGVKPETLTSLLDPDTKRLTKIASNKIQENKIRIWNAAINLALYKPDSNNSLYWSPLRYRPNIITSPTFKDSVKMADQQLQLNKISDQAEKKAQSAVNIGTKTELAHQEKKKFTLLQTTWKKILRSHTIMVVSPVEEEMKVKDSLKKITRDTKNPLKNHYNQIVGFAWILLITEEANKALQEWVEIDSPTELIVSLMTRHAVLARKKGNRIRHFPNRRPMFRIHIQRSLDISTTNSKGSNKDIERRNL